MEYIFALDFIYHVCRTFRYFQETNILEPNDIKRFTDWMWLEAPVCVIQWEDCLCLSVYASERENISENWENRNIFRSKIRYPKCRVIQNILDHKTTYFHFWGETLKIKRFRLHIIKFLFNFNQSKRPKRLQMRHFSSID